MIKNATAILDFAKLVELLDGNGAAKFISLTYRSKPKRKGLRERLARYTILLNVNARRAMSRDLAVLAGKLADLKGIDRTACEEMIASLTESLTTGQNSRYTKQGYYEGQGKGNVQVSVKGECYIRGYVVRTDVIQEAEYPKVNSRPLTLAKKKLQKGLKRSRIREFKVTPENFLSARVDGNSLVIDASSTSLQKLANLPPVTLATPVTA